MKYLLQPILRLAKRAPKLLAGIWFSGCGFVAVAVMFVGSAMRGGPMAVFASIVLPTVSAGLVGYLYGSSILDMNRTRTHLQAFLRGVLVILLTFLVFTPLLVLFHSLTSGGGFPELPSFIALSLFVLIAEFVTAFPVVFCVTTMGAITLFRIGRQGIRAGSPRPTS